MPRGPVYPGRVAQLMPEPSLPGPPAPLTLRLLTTDTVSSSARTLPTASLMTLAVSTASPAGPGNHSFAHIGHTSSGPVSRVNPLLHPGHGGR